MDFYYGERLKKFRKSQGLSLDKFAKRIGVSKATMINYEKNETKPDIGAISRMVIEFNLNANWLITGKGEMFPESESKEIHEDELIRKLFVTYVDEKFLPIIKSYVNLLKDEYFISTLIDNEDYLIKTRNKKKEDKERHLSLFEDEKVTQIQ